jgi:hypothetical protein
MCGCMNWRWWWISRARFASSFFADLSTTCGAAVSYSDTRKRAGSVAHLGAIGELVRSKIDLAKRALPNQPAEGVIADVAEVLGREFAGQVSVLPAAFCLLRPSHAGENCSRLTLEVPGTRLQALSFERAALAPWIWPACAQTHMSSRSARRRSTHRGFNPSRATGWRAGGVKSRTRMDGRGVVAVKK